MRIHRAVLALLGTGLLASHAAAQSSSARVQGKVTDGATPLAGVQVVLTNEQNQRVYKARTDSHGVFDVIGVQQSSYKVEVFTPAGELSYRKAGVEVASSAARPVTLTVDVSQKVDSAGQSEPQPKLTPEQIEEIKKRRDKALAENALITQAMNAMNAKQWQDAIAPLSQLVATEPSNWQYPSALGDCQLNLGHYEEAVATYDQGIRAAQQDTPVDPRNPATDPAKKKAGMAKMLTNQGNAYLKLHKSGEAIADYKRAAELDPNPATAYFNLCATQYNMADVEGALDSCTKAIAADPGKADAYFIKGSLLLSDSKMDKDGKLQPPPGTAEALNKYLELKPEGPHAADVKQMLAAIGAPVETTYKQKK